MLTRRLRRKVSATRVCATLTQPYLDALERLTREVYVSQAEAMRDALRRLFRHYGIWTEIIDTQDRSREDPSPEGPLLFQNL